MAEKNFNARFKQKHDIEANWAKATFIPLAGEFIVYDVDENNSTPRIKIGDGETQINNLPFVDEGKMSYLGEVNELPQTANEGDVCTFNGLELISDKQFIDSLLEVKTSPNEFYGIEIIYSNPLEGFGISDTIGEYDIVPSKYLYIIDKNNVVHSLKVNKVIYKAHYAPGSPYQDGFTTLYYEDFTDFPQYSTEMRFEGKAYYVGDEPASISFEQKEYLMIYRNSKWEKLVPEAMDSGLKNLLDGEPEGSLQTQNAQVLGANSIALGENAIAGCMAYYIKSIDLTNKKIYLSTTQTVPTISTDDNTDWIFVTPGYIVGNKFSIDSGNYYGYCGTITNISYNVISYSEDSLGFDSIVAVDGDLEIDDYTLHVPTQPEVGIVNIVENAVAIGIDNKATGKNAFAEGGENIADGGYAHVEGRQNYASYASHAEGRHNIASGVCAHAEGYWTTAIGVSAHVEGQENKGIGQAIHVEGMKNEGYGEYSHVEGYLNKLTVEGKWGHVEGYDNEVSAEKAHAEGTNTTASGIASHAEGTATKASAANAHAEGVATQATGEASHAEGNNTVASKAGAHAEGQSSKAQGDQSHAEGFNTEATAQGAHAEGRYSKAKSEGAHAEGHDTQATGQYSHAEGYGSKATASGTHAEGWASEASGFSAHAEGHGSIASGGRAHAEGYSTTAKGENGSHAEGHGTIAAGVSQHVQGKYNIEDSSKAHIVGWGSSTDDRKNIHTLDTTGNAWFAGNITVGSGNKVLATEEFVNNKFNDMGSLVGESSGPKTIGFTDNCDYIATPTDGLTAFQNAIADAADGDIILVMPGTYTSTSTLTIDKNINFIGMSSPIINFPINVLGPVYDFENWSGWLSEIEYDVHFENLIFNNQVCVNVNAYDIVKSSRICAIDCMFNGADNLIKLGFKGKAYNCIFNNSKFGSAGYIGYGGGITDFYNCKFNNITYTNGYYTEIRFKYYNCDISFANNDWEYPGGTFDNCNISATTEDYITIQTEYPGVSLNNCKIFGKNPFRASNTNISYTNTFVFAGSVPGASSGGATGEYVTRTEMEEYVNETIIGGEW